MDPARPLIDRYATKYFRLTKDDAYHVQIIHTNSGFLGEENQVGHVDFCVNGGMRQPGCKGNQVSKYHKKNWRYRPKDLENEHSNWSIDLT